MSDTLPPPANNTPAANLPKPWPVWRVWPRSLAGRTALVLLLALTMVQAAGLTIHALDRVDLQRFAQAREISARAISAWRTVILAPTERRAAMLAELELPTELSASLDERPLARLDQPPVPPQIARMLRLDLLSGGPPRFRPREVITSWDFRSPWEAPPWGVGRGSGSGHPPGEGKPPRGERPAPPSGATALPGLFGGNGPSFLVSLRLPSGEWLNLRIALPPPRPWHSETFLIAFVAMTMAAGLLTLWAVRRLTRPVRALAEAAERLGRDVNAPPMPEAGPTEVAKAAHAFNTMAERIRRFVSDRTQMLAAIGHDLRTPITRLRLRAEFMDDDEQRRKMLSDLDEMEAMVAATLAFARDDSAGEPTVALDLAALCRTVLDEAADARPDLAEAIGYAGPERLTVRARPVALKRALANLVGNALAYGNAARLVLTAPETPGQGALGQGALGQKSDQGAGKGAGQGAGRSVRLAVEDDGPGIPPDLLEAVFQPFRRLEGSRNRETGGTGLGLPIARNILRAHGGDVVLRNRPGGG
ncbi:MAG: Two component system histidine kinase, partial [Belnapia sp.]|nr:Two component system histidine kinase [Belnapia sp.]